MIDDIFGTPVIHPEAFISSKATIVGDVTIEKNVIVAPSASIRADEGAPFFIGKGTNIQDHVNLHGLLNRYVQVDNKQYSIYIGTHCSIAHGALIHGPTKIGKKTFIGFKVTVHNSIVGRNCFIKTGADVENSNCNKPV